MQAASDTGRRRHGRTGQSAAIAVAAAAVIAAGAWLIIAPLTRTSQGRAPAAAMPPVTNVRPPGSGRVPDPPANRMVLSPAARAKCPPAAAACADLTRHVTWLQSGGRVTYGPVPMEPGGSGDRTPRGTFHVAWKAGAHYISTSYGVPIPYAVFFAAGGVAFHAGSLTTSSHGCIHLTLVAARYYNEHLPVGAEVVVF
jgi:hypothetical protein